MPIEAFSAWIRTENVLEQSYFQPASAALHILLKEKKAQT
jgi:hypothetical protein